MSGLHIGMAGYQEPHLLSRMQLFTGDAWFFRPAVFLQGILVWFSVNDVFVKVVGSVYPLISKNLFFV